MAETKNKSKAIQALEVLSFEMKRVKCPNVPYLIRTTYRDDRSNDLTKCVIDWITLNGYQSERINSTGRQIKIKGQNKWIPGSQTIGTSDISATIKGRSVKIEIKCAATGDRYQSKEQKQYQLMIERAGGVYIIVRDFQGFYNWYLKFVTDGR
ncbi:MAG: hypothetical protein IPL55_09375 [Saprospiraceae bacterium]|nr:hypothetical protein [Saprospiraceae bacterium]MBL0027106.1 hypothetical protein [Saprospiraceae bacterium]